MQLRNIRHIVTHNLELDEQGALNSEAIGFAYAYDHLHRIKAMEAWDNSTLVVSTAAGVPEAAP
jgi:hypothetical protein